ncbi:DUF1203 domain-containing protein [Yinghuangia seranimata]|uniref:DUF1203 domain-containing protein n=1 Tax=Yinghuangia seranimata TaxID=408067 RepID=UPI00248CD2F4|nr:DUF1203 domain-containing protein [Yinghuangia seranimata]MDI2130206.1 DUF1203 domain-containing protein [Yinghuangia seranimata]
MTTAFRIIPIDETVAKEVRTTLRAPGYGHPAYTEDIEGGAPCRLCLAKAEPGRDSERMILFTYDAFQGQEELPLPGPVYVHERDCVPYADTGRFPPHMVASGVILDAYAEGRRPLHERAVDQDRAEAALADVLSQPDVDYVHVRSRSAGCYLFTARRA